MMHMYMHSRIRLPTLCMPLKCSHITVAFAPISSNSKSFSKHFFPLDNACVHVHLKVKFNITFESVYLDSIVR